MTSQKRGAVNRRYFRNLLQDRQISQGELGRRMRPPLDPSAISRSLAGDRAFSTEEKAQIARILDVPFDEILRNLSVDVPPMRKGGQVAVIGEVAVSGEVTFGRAAGPRAVPVPPRETVEGMQAVRYSAGGALEGAHIYFRTSADVTPSSIGRLCICVLVDGRTLLATPRAGDSKESYDLYDMAGREVAHGAWLESTSPVVWIKTA